MTVAPGAEAIVWLIARVESSVPFSSNTDPVPYGASPSELAVDRTAPPRTRVGPVYVPAFWNTNTPIPVFSRPPSVPPSTPVSIDAIRRKYRTQRLRGTSMCAPFSPT